MHGYYYIFEQIVSFKIKVHTMDNPNSIFAQNMRLLMEARGFTYKALSDATGLGQASIARFVSGAVKPRPKSLRALAASLRVDEKTLLTTPITDVEAVTIPEDPSPSGEHSEDTGTTEPPSAAARPEPKRCPLVRMKDLAAYFCTEPGEDCMTVDMPEVPSVLRPVADQVVAVIVDRDYWELGIRSGDTLYLHLTAFIKPNQLVLILDNGAPRLEYFHVEKDESGELRFTMPAGVVRVVERILR